MNFFAPTTIKKDMDCPKRTKFAKDKETQSPGAAFGECGHAGMAGFLRSGDPFMTGFTQRALELGIELDNETQERAEKAWKAFLDSQLKIDRDQLMVVESDDGNVQYYGKKMMETVIVPGQWGLRWILDCGDIIEEKGETIFRVTDWKFGSYEDPDDVQLAGYALAVWKQYGFKKIRTGFFYPEQGGKYRYSNWDENSLVGAFDFFHKHGMIYLSRKEWPEKVNRWCPTCPLRGECKTYNHALVTAPPLARWEIEPAKENLPTIITIFNEVNAIYKAVEPVREKLDEARKSLLLEHKEAHVDGKVWFAYQYTSRHNVDVRSLFVKASEILGRNPFEILKFDSGAYDEMVAAEPDPVKRQALKDLKKECSTPGSKATKVSSRVDKAPPVSPDPDEEIVEPVPVTTGTPDQIAAAFAETEAPKTETIPPSGETNPPESETIALEKETQGTQEALAENPSTAPSAEPPAQPPTDAAGAGPAQTGNPPDESTWQYCVCLACGAIKVGFPPEYFHGKACAACHGQNFTNPCSKEGAQKAANAVKDRLQREADAFQKSRAPDEAPKKRGGRSKKPTPPADPPAELPKDNPPAGEPKAVTNAPAGGDPFVLLCWNCGEVISDPTAKECPVCKNTDALELASESAARKNSADVKEALKDESPKGANDAQG